MRILANGEIGADNLNKGTGNREEMQAYEVMGLKQQRRYPESCAKLSATHSALFSAMARMVI